MGARNNLGGGRHGVSDLNKKGISKEMGKRLTVQANFQRGGVSFV